MTIINPKNRLTPGDHPVYLLKGRGIDGACWRSGTGWADLSGLATAYHTHEGVAGALAEARWEYDRSSFDDCIGCLEIQTITQADYDERVEKAYTLMEIVDAEWEADDQFASKQIDGGIS